VTIVQKNDAHSLTIASTTGVSTSGKTVYVYLISGDSTPIVVGSGAGAAAGTDITIACDFSLVSPGVYEMEAVANPSDTNPVILLPPTATDDPIYVQVAHRKSYS